MSREEEELVLNEEITTTDVVIFYLASIGGLVATILAFLILFHILYHYRQMFCIKNNMEQKQKAQRTKKRLLYHLFILNLITTISASIMYTWIRTNIFSGASLNTFSEFQCEFGAITGWISILLAKFFLFWLFLLRIKLLLKDSKYEYNYAIYPVFLIIMIIQMMITIFFIFFDDILHQCDWILFYEESINVVMCAEGSQMGQFAGLIALGFELFDSAILLYLFIKGLYSLNKSLHPCKISNHSPSSIKQIDVDTDSDHHEFETANAYDGTNTEQVSIDVELNSKPMETVVKLHDLMKKQTILVCVSVLSSICIYVLTAYYHNIALLMPWDLIINSICGWLMFGIAHKYWNVFTKFGCCCLYRKQEIQ